MKCFKSFFKHTWHPQQMESPPRCQPGKAEGAGAGETELGEIKVTTPMSNVASSTGSRVGSVPCQNGGCKVWRSRVEPRAESPWHLLKTIFLISVILALILWVIVYTVLAQYQIL